MNGFNFLIPPTFYVEIGHDFLKASSPAGGLELRLERQPNGRLTQGSKEKMTLRLQEFLKKKPWQPRVRVLCAISARGVTLRRLTLPSATPENLQKLLLLQIESEFPLPPEELAWGYRPANEAGPLPGNRVQGLQPSNGKTGPQDLLVVAVKKEVVEEYAEIFSACGAHPFFTLAALARSRLCPSIPEAAALLDVGLNQSELISFANGIPSSVRVLPWGTEVLTRSIEGKLGVGRAEAERLVSNPKPVPDREVQKKPQDVVEAALEPLAAALNGVKLLYLSGAGVEVLELASRLAGRLGPGAQCEPLESAGLQGPSTAILGLQRATEQNGAAPLLLLQVKPANGHSRIPRGIAWHSARPALALILALLCLPYAEAFLLKPWLSHKLTALKANKGRLQAIDRELGFLQYLKQNQSPYLDAMFLLSKAAPPGAHIDSLSMNRHGDLTLRITMREPTQVVDFRAKLIDSKFFSNVSVEEQAPSPDRQKLNVRLSAQWKAANVRESLAIGPTAQEIEQAKTNKNKPMGAPPFMPGAFPSSGPAVSAGPAEPAPGNVRPKQASRRSPASSPDVKASTAPATNGGTQ